MKRGLTKHLRTPDKLDVEITYWDDETLDFIVGFRHSRDGNSIFRFSLGGAEITELLDLLKERPRD